MDSTRKPQGRPDGATRRAQTNSLPRPCDCKGIRDVCGLTESVKELGRFWMMIQHDGAVILIKQEKGSPTDEQITIPRSTFQSFLYWYEKEQGGSKGVEPL